MTVKVLMIDDHPSMIEGYKIILSYNDLGYNVEVKTAYSCKEAYEIITKKRSATVFDMIFLDYSLPPYEGKKIANGEDLAVLIRDYFPKAKIVILTSHTEAILLYNIPKRVKPEGLLVKSDFTAEELIVAFDTVINDVQYYSQTVKQIVKDLSSNVLYLDSINREIISLVAKGVKTKSLPNYINLSLSAVEKRKVFIKEYFDIKKGTDEDIIRVARKQGLV
jgi:two-component system, NarL family, response regulator NreC